MTPGEKALLESEGFVVIGVKSDISTLKAASEIGVVIDFRAVSSAHGEEMVQELRPKGRDVRNSNHYHGNFGFGEYPAHTDFAHWSIPPRYLMLRSRIGFKEVQTYVYSKKNVLDIIPENILRHALFVPRKGNFPRVALSMKIAGSSSETFRWDSIFVEPYNSFARRCVDIFSSKDFIKLRMPIALESVECFLLIDNWKCMHGRSAVPPGARSRVLDRVYLERLYGMSD